MRSLLSPRRMRSKPISAVDRACCGVSTTHVDMRALERPPGDLVARQIGIVGPRRVDDGVGKLNSLLPK